MNYRLIQLLVTMLMGGYGLPAAAAELSGPLTREQLIQTVVAENPGIAALEAAEQATIARIEPAGDLDDPMLSTSVAPRQFGGSGEINRSAVAG
ncbi:MAG: hypothetical protein WD572_06055 [Gammaproteobacteria bacterium]